MNSKYFIYHIIETNNGYELNHIVTARSASEAVSVAIIEKSNIDEVRILGDAYKQKASRIASESL